MDRQEKVLDSRTLWTKENSEDPENPLLRSELWHLFWSGLKSEREYGTSAYRLRRHIQFCVYLLYYGKLWQFCEGITFVRIYYMNEADKVVLVQEFPPGC